MTTTHQIGRPPFKPVVSFWAVAIGAEKVVRNGR